MKKFDDYYNQYSIIKMGAALADAVLFQSSILKNNFLSQHTIKQDSPDYRPLY